MLHKTGTYLGRGKVEEGDQGFKASLTYRVSWRPAWVM